MSIRTHHHLTRDSASPTLANGSLRVALFRPKSDAVCRCAAGECKQADCDALYVLDSAGEHLATFHGSAFRAIDEENASGTGVSGLCIYKMPSNTRDNDRLLALRDALARLNRKNAEYWKRKEEEA